MRPQKRICLFMYSLTAPCTPNIRPSPGIETIKRFTMLTLTLQTSSISSTASSNNLGTIQFSRSTGSPTSTLGSETNGPDFSVS